MKPTFKINKKEWSFGEVTIDQFIKIKKYLDNPKKGDEFSIVSIMSGCPVEDLKLLKYNDWVILWDEAVLIISNISKAPQVKRITFKDTLIGLTEINDMTIGEWADLDIIISNGEWDPLSVISILWRKVEGNKLVPHSDESFNWGIQNYGELPAWVYHMTLEFFFLYANQSLKNIKTSLLMEGKMLKKEELMKIQKIQVEFGGAYSILSLGQILSSLKALPGYRSEVLLTGLLGNNQNLEKKSFKWRLKEYINKKRKV